MNNKGFTLTELLVTLTLIVILALIVSNNVISVTKKQETDRIRSFNNSIEKAACLYADLTDISDTCIYGNCVVTINDLISEGLLDANLKNPDGEKVSTQGLETVFIKHGVDGEKECIYNADNDYDLNGPVISVQTELGSIKIDIDDNIGLYATQISDLNMEPVFKNASNYKNRDDDLLEFYGGGVKHASYEIIPKNIKTIYVHSVDVNNNYTVEKIDITSSIIDYEPPRVGSTSIVKEYQNTTSKNYVFTLVDNISLSGYAITNTVDDPSSYVKISGVNHVVNWNFTSTGNYYIHMIDRTGNKSSQKVFVDIVKPTVNNVGVAGNKLNFNLQDNGTLSGYLVSTNKFNYNDNTSVISWKSVTGNNTNISETISSTGTYYIYTVDNQYNVSLEKSAFVDLTKPTITKFSFVTASKKFEFTFTDNDKVKDYVFTTSSSVPSSGWTNVGQSSYSGSKVVSSAGTYYLYVRDNNGNIQSSAVAAPKTAFSYAATASKSTYTAHVSCSGGRSVNGSDCRYYYQSNSTKCGSSCSELVYSYFYDCPNGSRCESRSSNSCCPGGGGNYTSHSAACAGYSANSCWIVENNYRSYYCNSGDTLSGSTCTHITYTCSQANSHYNSSTGMCDYN